MWHLVAWLYRLRIMLFIIAIRSRFLEGDYPYDLWRKTSIWLTLVERILSWSAKLAIKYADKESRRKSHTWSSTQAQLV